MDISTISIMISIVSVSFAVFFGLKNNRRSDEKEIAERIARDTKTDMKLDAIAKDVKEVKETSSQNLEYHDKNDQRSKTVHVCTGTHLCVYRFSHLKPQPI